MSAAGAPKEAPLCFDEVTNSSAAHWGAYWQNGGMVDIGMGGKFIFTPPCIFQ
jgi:hypothetical protein